MDADCLLSTLLLFDFLNANTFYLLSNSTRPLSYPHIRSCGYLGHLKAQPHTNPNFLSFQLSYFSTLSYIKTASPLRAAFSPVCQAFSSSLIQSLSLTPSPPSSLRIVLPFSPLTNLDTTVAHINYKPTFPENLYTKPIVSKPVILKIGLKLSLYTIFSSTRLQPVLSIF